MLVSQTQDVQVLAMRCPPGLWTGQSSTEGFSQTWIAPRSSLSACTGSKVHGVVCLLGKWHGDALRDTFKGTQQTDGALLPSHRAHANAIWFIWFSLSQYGRTRLNTFLWAAFFPLFEQIHWLLEDWVDQVPIEVKKEDVIVWAVIELLSVDRMVFCMSCVIPFLTISISKLILQWTTGFKTTSLHSCNVLHNFLVFMESPVMEFKHGHSARPITTPQHWNTIMAFVATQNSQQPSGLSHRGQRGPIKRRNSVHVKQVSWPQFHQTKLAIFCNDYRIGTCNRTALFSTLTHAKSHLSCGLHGWPETVPSSLARTRPAQKRRTEEKRELICKKRWKMWKVVRVTLLHAASICILRFFQALEPKQVALNAAKAWRNSRPTTSSRSHCLQMGQWASNDKWSMRNFAQIDLLTDMISIFAYPPVGWCQQVSLLPPLASPISFRNPHYALGDAWSRAQGHGFKQRHLFREVSWFLQDPQPDSFARRSTMSVNALWRSPQCIAWMGVPCSQIHVPLITY